MSLDSATVLEGERPIVHDPWMGTCCWPEYSSQANSLAGPGGMLHFEDVGTYRLLLDVWERDPDEIRVLYEDTIGPVDRYDQASGTQLTETLMVFFRNNENLTKTAADLFAHRHTIRYRLEKIAEISGLSVFQTEHKERLGLGLKARSLLTS